MAPFDYPVLLLGESGTGKSLVAHVFHGFSGPDRPFVYVNSAGPSDSLADSTLFGHRRGSFTGASRDHAGLLVQADGGTLFLDEVADLSAVAQAKLLHALERKRFRPVGAEEERASDFRLVAATNADLEERIAQGAFRQDLYHRLGAARVVLPPLRDRPEEIAPLARRFLAEMADSASGDARLPRDVSDGALALLEAHHWPGNVRQLRNVVTVAASFAQGRERLPAEAVEEVLIGMQAAAPKPRSLALEPAVRRTEERHLRLALARTGGDKRRAAELLDIGESTLYRKLSELGVDG